MRLRFALVCFVIAFDNSKTSLEQLTGNLQSDQPGHLEDRSSWVTLNALRMNGERRGGKAETQIRCLVCGNLIVAGESERAKVSRSSPVWSTEQNLSSFSALNDITVPASLGN
ncbi:unnamed protein product [Pleuronectes platessa]|uniref:Uncharacterized protein n=1 Tax=Pleuronectes platessa TaxID=8262 RepID=A0A9N7Z0W6_PLEPL|nr:unnamed protein product [Pleuronectes platessa]